MRQTFSSSVFLSPLLKGPLTLLRCNQLVSYQCLCALAFCSSPVRLVCSVIHNKAPTFQIRTMQFDSLIHSGFTVKVNKRHTARSTSLLVGDHPNLLGTTSAALESLL